MANGIDTILQGHQVAGQGLRGMADAFEDRNTRLDREGERKAKLDADKILAERRAALAEGIPGLAEEAQNPDFDQQALVAHPTTQAYIKEATDSGDPRVLDSLRPIQDIINQRNKLDEESVRAGGAEKIEARKLKAEQRQGAKDELDRLYKIRDGHKTHKTTTSTNTLRESFGKIKAAAKSETGPGDLSLIFAYMKMLDPTSAVRKEEFENAEKAKSWLTNLSKNDEGELVLDGEKGVPIPSFILTALGKATPGKGGAFLLPAQRDQFVSEASGLFRSQLEQQKDVDNIYRADADVYKIDHKRIAPRYADDDIKDLDKFDEERKKTAAAREKAAGPKSINSGQREVILTNPNNQAEFTKRVAAANAARKAAGLDEMNDTDKQRMILLIEEQNKLKGPSAPAQGDTSGD